MTIIYLLLSFLWGWFAFNLYYPSYDNGYGSIISFFAGWLVGELALHVIAVGLILNLLFVMGGVVDGFFGALALFIFILSWGTMAYFYLRGERAADDIEVALLEGLGADYTSDDTRAASLAPDRDRLIRPFPLDLPGVEVIKNISFGSSGQRLDIYRPYQARAGMPVLLQIHGGAWTEKMGSKNEQARPLMNHMALDNWICISIDYRLSPTATFPEHIIDCKEGLAWIRKNVAEYGGDPEFVVVTGGSAGGHLSSLLALTANDPAFQPGFEDVDTRVDGCVPFYGIYDFLDENRMQHNSGLKDMLETSIIKESRQDNPQLYKQLSPLHRIHPDAPPMLIIQGDTDTLVSLEEARLFADQLRDQSNAPVCYAEITGAQHAFDVFPSLRSELVKMGVARFLNYLLRQHQQHKSTEGKSEQGPEPTP